MKPANKPGSRNFMLQTVKPYGVAPDYDCPVIGSVKLNSE
jgi:hypothetical protein